MYNLFSKFYCRKRERETTRDVELKKYNFKMYELKIGF